MYNTNLHNLKELRNNICREISTISGQEVQRVNNVLQRYIDCILSGEQHFQELL